MAGEMEVAKGMLRTLIKVTFGYPAIFDEVRQECQINNAHVVAGCGSGCQSVYGRCQSCRTSVRESSGQGENPLSQKATRRTGHDGRFFYACAA